MKTRVVHTKVWEKDHFTQKSKDAKLLFMYLITNSRINLCGAYEIADRIIAADTGMTTDELEAAKTALMPKVVFFKGWVYVKNAQKYSMYKGEKNEKAKQRELAELPDEIKKCFIDGVCDVPRYPTDRVSESKEVVVASNLWKDLTPARQVHDFLENEDAHFEGMAAIPAQLAVKQWLMATWKVSEQEAIIEMGKFISYWTEPMPSGKKMRWQTEKTFELKRRFIRWMSNKHGKPVENNKYQAGTV